MTTISTRATCWVVVALLLATASCAHRAPTSTAHATSTEPAPSPEEEKQVSQWASHYYERPEPARVPTELVRIDRIGLFQKETAAAPLMAFFALVFRANPDALPGWASVASKFSDSGIAVVSTALWYSKTSTARGVLESLAASESGASRVGIMGFLAREAPEISSLPIDRPSVLDMLWGAFFASGDPIYVQRVISVLPDLEAQGNSSRRLIGWAAQWSLTSNAIQHARVLEICKSEAARSEGDTARILAGVIAKAKSGR